MGIVSMYVHFKHEHVIKWRHFPCYWPFVQGIHRWPVNSPRKGQWRGALMFSLICTETNVWASNRGAGDLRRHRVRYDVNVMEIYICCPFLREREYVPRRVDKRSMNYCVYHLFGLHQCGYDNKTPYVSWKKSLSALLKAKLNAVPIT